MGDNDKTTTTTLKDDPAANPPDAAAVDKGKGKANAVEEPATQDLSMDDDEESEEESGPEDIVSFITLAYVARSLEGFQC